jgi:hypothetical protein
VPEYRGQKLYAVPVGTRVGGLPDIVTVSVAKTLEDTAKAITPVTYNNARRVRARTARTKRFMSPHPGNTIDSNCEGEVRFEIGIEHAISRPA